MSIKKQGSSTLGGSSPLPFHCFTPESGVRSKQAADTKQTLNEILKYVKYPNKHCQEEKPENVKLESYSVPVI